VAWAPSWKPAEYIRAGAEVIITNTYAAARPPLAAAGLGDQVDAINRGAAVAALAARTRTAGDRPVAIAGSLSHVQMGDSPREWPTDDPGIRDVYAEQAGVLADAGVDVIVIEMATAAAWVLPAVDAALDTGLPVWVGLSFDRPEGGGAPTLRGNPDEPTDGLVQALIAKGVTALFIMHTEVELVDDVLPDLVAAAGPVPVGVYPHSGTFIPPRWTFGNISPEDLATAATGWVTHGARFIGGCCGTTPAHIYSLVNVSKEGQC
jgi:methionine synthase I (cobalamin-dependent)